MTHQRPNHSRGFTLIELLTVIAIIGILAGIIIPTVGAVQQNAKKSKTKAMFSQWISALELFRQDYGYYPTFDFPEDAESGDFVRVLTGDPTETDDNPKNIRYYSFSEDSIGSDSDADDQNDGMIVDAFGNPNLGMAVDQNQDGKIDFDSEPTFDDPSKEIPDQGIRASVVFWSKPRDDEAERRYGYEEVVSW